MLSVRKFLFPFKTFCPHCSLLNWDTCCMLLASEGHVGYMG
jgi:hypothetical protein